MNWEAISAIGSIVTALIAVAGATWIGLRQAEISERQADIAERQTGLEQRQLDQALYDRRYEIYDAAARFLVEGIQDQPVPAEVKNKFVIAMEESRFLLGDDARAGMHEIWKKVITLEGINRAMHGASNAGKPYAEGHPDKALELNLWIDNRIQTLHEMFGALRMGNAVAEAPSATPHKSILGNSVLLANGPGDPCYRSENA